MGWRESKVMEQGEVGEKGREREKERERERKSMCVCVSVFGNYYAENKIF